MLVRAISRSVTDPTAYKLRHVLVQMCLGTIAPKTTRRNEKERLPDLTHVNGIYVVNESVNFDDKSFEKLFAL